MPESSSTAAAAKERISPKANAAMSSASSSTVAGDRAVKTDADEKAQPDPQGRGEDIASERGFVRLYGLSCFYSNVGMANVHGLRLTPSPVLYGPDTALKVLCGAPTVTTAERETTTPGSRVASTAHAKTGKTPLPYTNVDRWAILGNRGLYFSTRYKQ